MLRRVVMVGLLAAAFAGGVLGQAQAPSFEVASVKRSAADGFPDFTPRRSGDRIAMHNIRLPSVVIYAYHLEHGLANTSYQLDGNLQLPEGWEVYDIDAIARDSPKDDDLRVMFRNLLQDRFRLKAHWETKQLPVYEMVLAKGGARLTASVPGRKVDAARRLPQEPGVSRLIGRGDSIEQLVKTLSARLELPVRNLSGLTGGAFDYEVWFARDDLSNATSVPDLVTAVEVELGLKLRKGRGPVEVLVVDHVEKPSEN